MDNSKKIGRKTEKRLKDHIIKKDRIIKNRIIKSEVADEIKISRVRIVESKNCGATFPRNEGSGITIEKDCRVDVEINGKWHKIWE